MKKLLVFLALLIVVIGMASAQQIPSYILNYANQHGDYIFGFHNDRDLPVRLFIVADDQPAMNDSGLMQDLKNSSNVREFDTQTITFFPTDKSMSPYSLDWPAQGIWLPPHYTIYVLASSSQIKWAVVASKKVSTYNGDYVKSEFLGGKSEYYTFPFEDITFKNSEGRTVYGTFSPQDVQKPWGDGVGFRLDEINSGISKIIYLSDIPQVSIHVKISNSTSNYLQLMIRYKVDPWTDNTITPELAPGQSYSVEIPGFRASGYYSRNNSVELAAVQENGGSISNSTLRSFLKTISLPYTYFYTDNTFRIDYNR
jgi:hypothetical protein